MTSENNFIKNSSLNEYNHELIGSSEDIYIVSVKINTICIVTINDKTFNLNAPACYNIPTKFTKSLKIVSTEKLQFIEVYSFGKPKVIQEYKYNILYSFDREYFIGFFASCNSFLTNISNKNKLNDLLINICIPINDLDFFLEQYLIFLSRINIEFNLSINLIANQMINKTFRDTKVFKGGNHLLNVGNFSRLLVGKLFNTDKLLYIDSDSIIQTDLLEKLDKINIGENAVLGKKSELTFNNILNSKYYKNISKLLGRELNLNNNIIYTGTLIFNPIKFIEYENNILNLVNAHNDLPDGLYKLFTMSLINISLSDNINFFDDYINNVIDLGINTKTIGDEYLKEADVLDWSGMYKPWYTNGLYKTYWEKYNVMDYTKKEMLNCDKNTIEIGLSIPEVL